MNENQIAAQVELGEGGDNAAEDKKRENGHDNHRKKLMGQDISKFLYASEICKHAIKSNEHARPEEDADNGKKQQTHAAVSSVLGNARIFKREVAGQKQRCDFFHKVSSPLPVRRRKTSSRSPSFRRAVPRRSPVVPRAIIRPRWII